MNETAGVGIRKLADPVVGTGPEVGIGKVTPGRAAEVFLETPRELEAAIALFREYRRATGKFGAFHSTHEGYAVIKEELDELWEEIRKKDYAGKDEHVREEAIQVAAMGLRFVVDCCPTSGKENDSGGD